MKFSEVFKNLIVKYASQATPVYKTGRPRVLCDAQAAELIFRVARTGMQWREIDFGANCSYVTVFRRFHDWKRQSVFLDAYRHALRVYKRVYPPDKYVIDSQYVRNKLGRAPWVGRNHTDRGRKAIKVSYITDQNGIVHALATDPGNRPDVTLLVSTLRRAILDLDAGTPLFADRGYPSRANQHACVNVFGLKDRIFRRKTKTTRRTNAARIVVEHAFAWRGAYRRLSALYEHTSASHESFSLLALGHSLCTRFSTCFLS